MNRHTVWHPCTQMKDVEDHPLINVQKAKGIYLFDPEGNSYIDAVSSWWVNLFGHCNPRLMNALKRQADTLDHVIFAGTTHSPAEKLAERLMELTPPELTHIFFADNGSAAVEAAMKMSYGYWHNTGKPGKTKFIALDNGYHGETLGALSLCGEELYTNLYGPIMPQNIRVQGPDCYRCPYGEHRATCDAPCFEHMERAVAENADSLSAVMVEPLVQFAGGFKMYPPVYLKKLRSCTEAHGVHLIFDEIATGFGRTGTMFAAEQAGVCADFVCLSKGITSGVLPLSVVLTNDTVYEAYYADYTELKAFMHSHSYTGNPLACAVGCETMDIFRDDDVINANRPKYEHLRSCVEDRFAEHRHVGEIRSTGFICAVELVADPTAKAPFDWKRRIGFRIYREAVKRGALLRNLGDTIYFLPPYVITKNEIETLVDIARESVSVVLD